MGHPMRHHLRHARRLAVSLVSYGWYTGKWWMPMIVVVLIGTFLLIATAKVVAPTAVYTLF